MSAQLSENFFFFEGDRLAFTQKGDGTKRLIFLHGAFGSKEIWMHQNAFFSNHCEVITIDLFGHGKSSEVEAKEAVTYNAKVIADLINELPEKENIVVAHSWGGSVLNELMFHTEKLAAAFFVDSSCLNSSEQIISYNTFADEILASNNPQEFIHEWFRPIIGEATSPVITKLILSDLDSCSPDWVAGLMRNYPSARFVNVKYPVVVVKDSEFYPEGSPISWLNVFQQATVWSYKGIGHFYQITHPDEFNTSLFEQINLLQI